MSRNSVVMFAVILMAFFVFITVKGQLVQYMATLGLAPRSKLPTIGAAKALEDGTTTFRNLPRLPALPNYSLPQE